MSSRCKWLSACLKDGRFDILRRLIPETLFYNTNLPLVRVFYSRRAFTPEQPDIALTYLIPGRVTYRYGRRGHVVPIKAPSDTTKIGVLPSLFSLILGSRYNYYILDRCSGPPQRSLGSLYPEELTYTIAKLLGRSASYECFELRGVHPPVFLPPSWNLSDPDITKNFGGFGYGKGSGSMYDAVEFIKNRQPRWLYQLSSKTVAYPRVGVLLQAGYRRFHGQDPARFPCEMDYYVGSNLIKYVYAEDTKISCRLLRDPTLDALSKRKPLARHTMTMTRILLHDDRGTAKPSVMGYRIDSTSSLVLSFGGRLEEILGGLLTRARSWMSSRADGGCGASSAEFYVALTVCQSLRDFVLYVLLKDLYSSVSRSKLMGLSEPSVLWDFTHLALLYSELEKPLCETLLASSRDDALKELKKSLSAKLIEFRQALEERGNGEKHYLVETKPYVVMLVYKGERARALPIKQLKKLKDSDIEGYVTDLVDRLEGVAKKLSISMRGEHWPVGLLRLAVSHTYTHHIIKQIALSGGLPTDFLGEYIDVKDNGVIESSIFESVSGGIAAIEGALASWGLLDGDRGSPLGEVQSRVESLLLRLGECAIGTPEDILYTRLLSIEDPIFMTPLELGEHRKLSRAFDEEVERFSRMWNLGSNELKREIALLLCESDTKFARFSGYDDVLLYYILNYQRLPRLRELFIRVLSKILQKQEQEVEGTLIELHSYVSDSRRERLDLLGGLTKVLTGMRSVLIRLIPRTCNPSCYVCYHNQRVCRYTDPEAQRLLLNRRLLKLVAGKILETVGGGTP